MKLKQTLLTTPILAATALAAVTNTSAASAIFTRGHGDLAVGFEDGEFEFGLHLGEGGDEAFIFENGQEVQVFDEEFEADELIIQVTEQLVLPASNTDLLNVTGGQPGATLYLLSQGAPNMPPPLLLLGLDTEELDNSSTVSWSDVSYTFEGATGPGLFSVFNIEGGEIDSVFSENQGLGFFTFPGPHDERNFTFTELGTYEVTITAEATRTELDVGSEDFSSTQTFTFQVIPEPSSALLLAASSFGLLLRRRRS